MIEKIKGDAEQQGLVLLGQRRASRRLCRKLALGRGKERFYPRSLAREGAGEVGTHLRADAMQVPGRFAPLARIALMAPGVRPVPSTATVVPGGAVGWQMDSVDGGICWTGVGQKLVEVAVLEPAQAAIGRRVIGYPSQTQSVAQLLMFRQMHFGLAVGPVFVHIRYSAASRLG